MIQTPTTFIRGRWGELRGRLPTAVQLHAWVEALGRHEDAYQLLLHVDPLST